MPHIINRHRQGGAVIVTAALTLLFLLGFMGIALDFGRLFVVKTELQTAVDSCALAAAQELDGAGDSLTRATNAGITSGNLNKVYFQGAPAGIISTEVVFSDTLNGIYSRTLTTVSNAKYAKCVHTKLGMTPWLLQAMGAFTGDATLGATQGVQALAVASRVPSQTNCALPVGLCKKTPNYQPGEWLSGAVNSRLADKGQFRWLDFTPENSGGGANELKNALKGEGQCNLPGTNTVAGEEGNMGGAAAAAYNSRFGIKRGGKKDEWTPANDGIFDLTGYSWYSEATLMQPPYPNKYPAFLEKRLINAKYQDDPNKPATAPDIQRLRPGGVKFSGSLAEFGSNRRIMVAPIVDCLALSVPGPAKTLKIDSLACILLLHPIEGGENSDEKMWVEYLGLANSVGSPCTTTGLAGGTGGPLVPALVQ